MENNLFKFATSELSQDAFICWLLNSLNYENNKNDNDIKNLKECAYEFLNVMCPETQNMKIDEIKPIITRQKYKIDILVEFTYDKKYIIVIEDKIASDISINKDGENQVEKYKKKIEKDENKEKVIKLVCYKIYDSDEEDYKNNFKKDEIIFINREKIYETLKKYKDKIKNNIFKDYYEYIEYIEKTIKNIDNLSLKEWKNNLFLYYYFANKICKKNNKILNDMELSTKTGGKYLEFAKIENPFEKDKIPYVHLTCAFREDKEDNFYIEIMLRGCSDKNAKDIKVNSKTEKDEIVDYFKEKLKFSDKEKLELSYKGKLDFSSTNFRNGKISLKLLKTECKTESYKEMLEIIEKLAEKLKSIS